jgi:hypothetical protein
MRVGTENFAANPKGIEVIEVIEPFAPDVRVFPLDDLDDLDAKPVHARFSVLFSV